MKCFLSSSTPNASGFLNPGILVQLAPFPHIAIGEEGRGRWLVRVPVTLELASANPSETDPNGGQLSSMPEARVMRSSDGKTIIAKAGEYPDNRCLVHLSYYSGFKGSCTWEYFGPDGQWYPFPYHTSKSPEPVDAGELITIIASGLKAEGDAGRVGQSEEHLAITKPGAMIRYNRTGRTYGKPKVLIMTWNGENFGIATPEDLAARTAQQALLQHPEQFKDL